MKLKDDLTLPKLEAISAPSAPDCNLKVIKYRHHPPCRYYQNQNFNNGFKVLIFETWALPILLLRLMSGNIEGRRADPTLLGHLHGIIVIHVASIINQSIITNMAIPIMIKIIIKIMIMTLLTPTCLLLKEVDWLLQLQAELPGMLGRTWCLGCSSYSYLLFGL